MPILTVVLIVGCVVMAVLVIRRTNRRPARGSWERPAPGWADDDTGFSNPSSTLLAASLLSSSDAPSVPADPTLDSLASSYDGHLDPDSLAVGVPDDTLVEAPDTGSSDLDTGSSFDSDSSSDSGSSSSD